MDSELYVVDERGDKKNVEYGYLHRYSVPQYNRRGRGRVLGSLTTNRIEKIQSSDRDIVLGSSKSTRPARLLASRRDPFKGQVPEVIASSTVLSANTLRDDYLSLNDSASESSPSDADNDGESQQIPNYRSLEPMKASDDVRGLSSRLVTRPGLKEHGTATTDSESYLPEIAKNSSNVRRNPKDDKSWLSLCELQRHLVRPGTDSRLFTTSERKTLAELRLSILHDAIAAIDVGHSGRENLLLAVIEEGALVWPRSKLEAKWQEVIGECTSSLTIWSKYLSFVQCHTKSYRYDDCSTMFSRCLDNIKAEQRTANDLSRIIVYVFLRFTTLVRDAGYAELSTALWQAVIEIAFFAPPDDSVDAFSEFWDSEAPRIGEEGARGWKSLGPDSDLKRPATNGAASDFLANLCSQESSLQAEGAFTTSFRLPTSMDDDDGSDDPFQCIMCSDIGAMAHRIAKGSSKDHIVNGILCFFGLPSLSGHFDDGCRTWWADPYLCRSSIRLDSHSVVNSDLVKRTFRLETIQSLFNNAFNHYAGASDERLLRFVDRVLGLLVQSEESPASLGQYYLSFKTHFVPTEARKTAKQLLKKKPSDVSLYNALGWIEFVGNNRDRARQIWGTAISMQSRLSMTSTDESICLKHSAIVAHMFAGDEEVAIKYLVSSLPQSSGSSDSAPRAEAEVLRSGEVMLQEGLKRTLAAGVPQLAVLYADSLALLTYMASSHDIETTSQSYGAYARLLAARSYQTAHETLLQYRVRTIRFHLAKHRPYKPSVLVDLLEAELKQFPNNSELLDLSNQLGAQDRIRSLMREYKVSAPAEGIVRWSFKLAGELDRGKNNYAGSTINSARRVFLDALDQDTDVVRTSHFWNAWVVFELQAGSPRQANVVFLQGLQHMPWVKEFALSGALRLRRAGALSDIEMSQVIDQLLERGIRLRYELES